MRRHRPIGTRLRRTAACALASLAALAATAHGQEPPAPAPPIDYAFVSMPDFLNADIADLSHLPSFDGSRENGTSPEWEQAIGNVLDAVQREGVRDLFVAGDLVEGEWGRDDDGSGIFGPVETRDDRRRAVVRAGSVYYRAAMRRFAQRGLWVYPAVGDHELGDNPWGLGLGWYEEFKYRNLGLFKHVFSRYTLRRPDGTHRFRNRPPGQANGTAYAVRPHPDVQLITLDVFRRGYRKGRWTVRQSIDRQQFDWADRVLTKANRDGVRTIIVQAHLPIAAPVRERHTSGLMYEKGVGSPLWRLMVRHRVDLYLAGEVHAVTTSHRDGILQIAHGGLMVAGEANYIVVRIAGPVITIQAKAFPGAGVQHGGAARGLWHSNLHQYRVPSGLYYPREPVTTGEMVLLTDNSPPPVHTGTLELGFQMMGSTGIEPVTPRV
jgi:hypothetical protein